MKRIASFALALIMVFTMTGTAFAEFGTSGFGDVKVTPMLVDTGSVAIWDDTFRNIGGFVGAASNSPALGALTKEVWWGVMDLAFSRMITGEVSYSQLNTYLAHMNTYWGTVLKNSVTSGQNGFAGIALNIVPAEFYNPFDLKLVLDANYGVYRIWDDRTDAFIVNSHGLFPYYEPRKTDSEESIGGDKWCRIDELDLSRRNITDYDTIAKMCVSVRSETGKTSANVYNMPDGVFGAIMYTGESAGAYRYVWADAEGHPYCYSLDDRDFALNTEQDYYVEDDDDDGKYDVGDTSGDVFVDLSDDTVKNIVNNTEINLGDLVYNEGDKIWNVDAHSEYYVDFENNLYYYYEYNFEFTYHINYTSVTYIGQTAEYNETYEFYYQLPDGRSSADLTVEELQALNTQIDVLPYIRSADDTSIRALYHFDGDTLDSSYWSYAGNIEWISGASLTYMDASAFNGALFLDETAHEFNVQLPSNLGSSDFTIQFRYYQSATIAPVTDSHISIGSNQVLQFSGDAFILSNGVTVPTSIGQWTELCFMRSGNTLYYFYNGVPIGFTNFTGTVSDVLNFTFGSEQQTYKYFDELRVTSKALYAPGGYTPTSVPFDTNLSLVLPDSKLPIADAYWDIKSEQENLLTDLGLDSWVNVSADDMPKLHINSSGIAYKAIPNYQEDMHNHFGWVYSPLCFYMNSAATVLSSSVSGSSLSNTGVYSSYDVQTATGAYSGYNYFAPTYGLIFPLVHYHAYNGFQSSTSGLQDPSGNYTLSIVFSDGSIESYTFNPTSASSAQLRDYTVRVMGEPVYTSRASSRYYTSRDYFLSIYPTDLSGTGSEFVYMQLVEGDSTDLTAEYVESVVAMDKDDLNTPSLAVRTDINITGYQIGGVRPSLPTKGLVWALVEDSMITSLQIYNGQAWEAVDGRIWTGSRWVPYYAYDVILLKDLYDIVESDPSLDYIYTESGFWKWLQGAWSQMMDQLSDIENAISGSGSGSGTINPNIPDTDKTGFFESLGEILLSIFSSIGDLLTGIFSFFSDTVFGGIKDFFSVFTDGSLFEGFQQTDEEGNTTTALPDGVSAVFAFFAGIFLVLPEEIRLILLFAIGLLIFMGVLKVVIS